MAQTNSILESTKKILGLDADYKEFDHDVIIHINSVFSTLQQLGVGPKQGYMILDEANEWSEFIQDDVRLNAVKTYLYLRVRMLFDPPQTGYLVTSLEKQVEELEWRLHIVPETTDSDE